MPASATQHCSARDARSHRKAKLRDLAENLSRFSALEEDCAVVQSSGKGTAVSMVTSQSSREEEQPGIGSSELGRLAAA